MISSIVFFSIKFVWATTARKERPVVDAEPVNIFYARRVSALQGLSLQDRLFRLQDQRLGTEMIDGEEFVGKSAGKFWDDLFITGDGTVRITLSNICDFLPYVTRKPLFI